MALLNEKIKMIIPLLMIFIVFVYTVKPNILFKPNNKLREYGVGYDNEGYKKTLYNLQLIIIIIVLIFYLKFNKL